MRAQCRPPKLIEKGFVGQAGFSPATQDTFQRQAFTGAKPTVSPCTVPRKSGSALTWVKLPMQHTGFEHGSWVLRSKVGCPQGSFPELVLHNDFVGSLGC